MIFLALRALVARIPTLAWVALGTVALAATLYGVALHRGRVEGRQQVVRAARADSIVHQRATVATAAAATDRVVAVAKKAAAIADVHRAKLAPLKALAVPALDSTPAPVVTYVAALEHQVADDSVALAVYAVVPDTAAAERTARIGLDTLQEHAKDDKPPDDGGVSAEDVAAGVGIGATLGAIAWGILHWLHR